MNLILPYCLWVIIYTTKQGGYMPENNSKESNNTLTRENTFSFELAKKAHVPLSPFYSEQHKTTYRPCTSQCEEEGCSKHCAINSPAASGTSITSLLSGGSILAMIFCTFPPVTSVLVPALLFIISSAASLYANHKINTRIDNLKDVEEIIKRKTKNTYQQENSGYNNLHELDLFEEIVNNYTGNWLSSSYSSRQLINVLRKGPNNTLKDKRKALDTYIKDKKNHPKRLFKDIIKTLKIEKDNSSTKERSFKVILPKTTDLGFS
jgi:hypothetical protein